MASAMAMIMYYVRLVDFAVFNNKFAAYVLVCEWQDGSRDYSLLLRFLLSCATVVHSVV